MKEEEYYKLVKSALKFYNYSYNEDILQELVFFVYCKVKDYDETKGELSTYVFKVVKNKYLQIKKKEDKNKCISLDKKINDDGLTLLELIKEEKNDKEEALMIFKLLTPKIKPPLRLWLEGYTQKEIAEKLGITHQPQVSKLINNNIVELKIYCKENNIKIGD